MRERTATLLLLIACSLAASCGGEPVTAATSPTTQTSAVAPSSAAASSPSPTTTSPSASETETDPPRPAGVPVDVPISYPSDVAAAAVPPRALVPAGTKVQGTSYAFTDSGEAIVVSWVAPGGDAFRAPQGWVAWRRFAEDPPWRPVIGEAYPARDGVLGITSLTADLTGDGSDDALVFASKGGTGACGVWSVVDLATGSVAYGRDLCDATVQPSANPVGLVVTASVYRDGDPHCCPSAFRTTVLTYEGDGTWAVASRRTEPT